MKLRLLAVAAVVALQLSAQTDAAKPARVLLQSGVYQLTEVNLGALSKPLTGESRQRVVRIFAFERPLTELEWANWSARGAMNHGYLPLNAYLVEIPVNATPAWNYAAQLPLRGAAPFTGAMKLSSTLASGSFPDYAWVGNEVELVVVPLATPFISQPKRVWASKRSIAPTINAIINTIVPSRRVGAARRSRSKCAPTGLERCGRDAHAP